MNKFNKEEVTEMAIYESLKEVIDPELYVNIVDLGLVYAVILNKETFNVKIEMTLTSQGCPMGDAIIQDVEETLKRIYPGIDVLVVLVWEPSWSMDMVTDEGHAKLNGF
ncbi:metal-sulfur cluster assembly factor [Brumimicrobium oceani]|uniref:FeS assembly SUF system protein SufT n=1 Tax=Brumimicrobium oceani TaxID=2100725 RepID=A0A2U2XAE4_9FLAO|nr:metal-sulfur cluster assembly factor [Brumimicrobium oceani]PWH84691.1 FeS assembly SUF system protein SufT [Brumimicrobium oceani]